MHTHTHTHAQHYKYYTVRFAKTWLISACLIDAVPCSGDGISVE